MKRFNRVTKTFKILIILISSLNSVNCSISTTASNNVFVYFSDATLSWYLMFLRSCFASLVKFAYKLTFFQDMLSRQNVNWKDKLDMLSHNLTWLWQMLTVIWCVKYKEENLVMLNNMLNEKMEHVNIRFKWLIKSMWINIIKIKCKNNIKWYVKKKLTR